MKLTFIVTTLVVSVALAEPEADPAVVGSVVSPLSFGPAYGGIKTASAALVPGSVTYAAHPLVYSAWYGRKKREADPGIVGTLTGLPHGPIHGVKSLAHKLIPGEVKDQKVTVHNAYAYPVPLAAGVYYGRKKREAEADPQVLIHNPAVAYTGYFKAPVEGLKISATQPLAFGVNAGVIPFAPAVYYGRKKREAEADPQILIHNPAVAYTGYGKAPLEGLKISATQPLAFDVTPGVIPLAPAVYYGRKKREAEADPQVLIHNPAVAYTGYFKAPVEGLKISATQPLAFDATPGVIPAFGYGLYGYYG